MTPSLGSLLAESSAVAAMASALSGDPEVYRQSSDDELMRLARSGAELARAASRQNALIAGEVARRSTRELGHSGLAQRQGFRTPEELVRVVTGSTAREAITAVRVGQVLGLSAPSPQPWLASVASAVSRGALSVAAAESIRTGIGVPSDQISAEVLAGAVAQLVAEASALDADRLYRRARDLRDEIDEAGIADREAALREKRSLWFKKLPDGSARLNWTLDPESSAIMTDLFDRATSPRRGGPRFVSGENEALGERLAADPRTTEQIASDTFLELLRQGAAADSSQLLGTGAPSVRVLVTEQALRTGKGHGRIEGQPVPVSIATVERMACSGGVQEILFDEDLQPIDVGREQRLFTQRQKRALAARDGGCLWPDCGAPPSWTEAHHCRPWARDQGRTDLENGVLLCRFHHLLLHNNAWQIVRSTRGFGLVPPGGIDPARTPIPLATKSPTLLDAIRDRHTRAG